MESWEQEAAVEAILFTMGIAVKMHHIEIDI